jgi:hypothetical protein
MKTLAKVTTASALLLTAVLTPSVKPVQAQSPESFSQCVLNLYRGPYSASVAADNCLKAFQGRPMGESFSECVDRLYRGPFSTNDASNYCTKAASQQGGQVPPMTGTQPSMGQPQQYYSYRDIRPVEGPNYNGWYRYEKPSDISDDLMKQAGAAFYDGPSACAASGYCLALNGTWVSRQSNLRVQVASVAYPQPTYGQPPYNQPTYGQPTYGQPPYNQPTYGQPNGQPPSGGAVPINQGYNQVGGIWFGPDGQPVPADRRPGEDPATCISRLRFFNLQATSRSEQHGDYRYDRPSNATVQQMQAAGLENRSFLSEKWRGSQPQVTLTLMEPQAATIRCR